MLITISNLYPRPDQPTRGMFNAQLFGQLNNLTTNNCYQNICLVPSWKLWQWSAIRRWKAPEENTLPRRIGVEEGSSFAKATEDVPEEEKENVLRFFQMAALLRRRAAPGFEGQGTPFEKIAKHLPGGRGEEGAVLERECVSDSPPRRVAGISSRSAGLNTRNIEFSSLSQSSSASVVKSSLSSLSASGQPSTIYLPVFYLPVVGRSVNDVFYAWALRKWAQTIKPGDVVYSPWLYPDGVAVERVLRGRGARVWLMALGSDTLRLQEARCRRKIVEACSAAEGIVCVAQVLSDRLATAGVPSSKLHVVPNGVDSSLFRVRNKEELSGCQVAELLGNGPNGQPLTTEQPNNPTTVLRTILFIGNLVPVKGPDILLRAFAALHEELLSCQVVKLSSESPQGRSLTTKQHSNLTTGRDSATTQQPNNSTTVLLIIGSGPLRAKLERLARDLGISDRVHFLGNRSHLDVARWMNVADVLCLASRNEGMPNVVLEARASGLPVVATPAGAIPELPLDKEHFLVVKTCSPEDLAAGLQEMLGRDLSNRKPDPAISTWSGMAERVLALMQEKAGLSV